MENKLNNLENENIQLKENNQYNKLNLTDKNTKETLENKKQLTIYNFLNKNNNVYCNN